MIHNVNDFEVIMLLDKILKETGIDFERKEKSIILTGFNNASIVFKSTLGTIEIDLKEIRGTKLYLEVKDKIKLALKLKEIEKDSFSYVGAFYILLGLVFF